MQGKKSVLLEINKDPVVINDSLFMSGRKAYRKTLNLQHTIRKHSKNCDNRVIYNVLTRNVDFQ